MGNQGEMQGPCVFMLTSRQNSYFLCLIFANWLLLTNIWNSVNASCLWDGKLFLSSPQNAFASMTLGSLPSWRGGPSQLWPLAWSSPVFSRITAPPSSLPPLKEVSSLQCPFPRWAAFQGIAISSDHSSNILKTPTYIFESKWLLFLSGMFPKDSR